MFPTRLHLGMALWLAIVVGVVAQERRQTPSELRGVIRAVDSASNSITISIPGRDRESSEEKTFTVAKDADVLLDEGRGSRFVFKEGKLADLHPGALVSLTLSADRKSVTSIVAEGPNLQGVVKAVDADKGTLTLALVRGRGEDAEEKTLTMSKNVEVVLDDGRGRRTSFKEGKLADLKAGSLATVKLSIDQKVVDSIVAEGPNVFGIVKAVDPKANTITLMLRQGRGEEAKEKTFLVVKDVDVLVDPGRSRRLFVRAGKFTDLKPGSVVALKMSLDQKTVVMIRAEGPTIYGTLKGVDAGKGTVTILTASGRGTEGKEKTFTLAKGARIISQGREIKLSELKAKDTTIVGVRLSLDQKTAISVQLARE